MAVYRWLRLALAPNASQVGQLCAPRLGEYRSRVRVGDDSVEVAVEDLEDPVLRVGDDGLLYVHVGHGRLDPYDRLIVASYPRTETYSAIECLADLVRLIKETQSAHPREVWSVGTYGLRAEYVRPGDEEQPSIGEEAAGCAAAPPSSST